MGNSLSDTTIILKYPIWLNEGVKLMISDDGDDAVRCSGSLADACFINRQRISRELCEN